MYKQVTYLLCLSSFVLGACSRQIITDTENISIAPSSFSNTSWQREGNYPKRLIEAQGITVPTLEGGKTVTKLYVFGGFETTADSDNIPLVPTSRAYSLNLSQENIKESVGTWNDADVADLSTGLTHAGIAKFKGKVYIAGGITGSFNKVTDFGNVVSRVVAYNAVSNSYTALPNLPGARAAGGLAVVNKGTDASPDWELHHFGGFDPEGSDSIFTHWKLQLDLSGNSVGGWQGLGVPFSSLRTRNHFGTAVAYDGGRPYIFMIGGQEGYTSSSAEFADISLNSYVDRYDVRNNTWQTVTSLPRRLNHIASSTITSNNSKIYVFGGSTTTALGRWSDRIYSFNAENGASGGWTNEGSLPLERSSTVAGVNLFNAEPTNPYFVITTGRSNQEDDGTCNICSKNETWSSSVQ